MIPAKKLRTLLSPLRISLLYIIIGVVWITFSDRFIATIAPTMETLTLLQTFKGWFYICSTGLLLYALIKYYSLERTKIENELEKTYSQFTSVINTTSDVFAITLPDGTITYLNRSGIELTGFYPEQNGNKKKITDFYPDWVTKLLRTDGFPTATEKGIWRGETAISDTQGHEVPVSQIIMSHRSADGSLSHFSTMMHDITDLKRKEEALKTSEEIFSKAFHVNPNPMFITRISDYKILDVNESFVNASGYTRSETIGKTTLEINLWNNQSERDIFFEKFTASGSIRKYGFEFRHRSGECRYGTLSGEKIRIGKDLCVLSVFDDITEQKKTEEELRMSHDFAHAIINSVPGIFFIYDLDRKSVTWNKMFRDVTGYSNQDIGSLEFLGEFVEEDRPIIIKAMAEVNTRGSKIVEVRLLTKDKNQIYYQMIGTGLNIHHKQYLIGMGIDITARKQAEELKRQVTERLQYLLTVTSIVILTSSITEPYSATHISGNVEELLGYRPAEMIGVKEFWFSHIHPDDQSSVKDEIQTLFSKGSHSYEYRIRRKDGSYIWVHDASRIPKYIKETGCEIIRCITDVTKRKEVEGALKTNEERLRLALEATTDALWDWDLASNKLYYSPRWYTMLGYEPDSFEANFENWANHTMPLDVEKTTKILENAIEHGKGFESEFRMKTADGGWRWILGRGRTTARDAQGRTIRFTGTNTDITERKEAEEILRASRDQLRDYSARLLTIREEERTSIAREIHDELGQILTGLKMDLALLDEILLQETRLTQRRELNSKINSMSNLMDSAIRSMRKIITELRPVILDTMGLSAAIEWQAEEFQHRTGIACYYSPPQDLPTLPKDFATSVFRFLQESLTNIARHSKAGIARITMHLDRGNLILLVHDNGRGIQENEKYQQKSFGITGMRERIELLGGKFSIHGTPGKGTLVSAEIPMPQ